MKLKNFPKNIIWPERMKRGEPIRQMINIGTTSSRVVQSTQNDDFWRLFRAHPRSSSPSKNIFRTENEIFAFIEPRDIIYIRNIKHKERVCNKSGWVLKIDIGLVIKSRGGPRTPLTEVWFSTKNAEKSMIFREKSKISTFFDVDF